MGANSEVFWELWAVILPCAALKWAVARSLKLLNPSSDFWSSSHSWSPQPSASMLASEKVICLFAAVSAGAVLASDEHPSDTVKIATASACRLITLILLPHGDPTMEWVPGREFR